jgi:hypothetical protein
MGKSVIVDLGKELSDMYLEADGLRAKIQAALDMRNRVMVERLVAKEEKLMENIVIVEKIFNHKFQSADLN